MSSWAPLRARRARGCHVTKYKMVGDLRRVAREVGAARINFYVKARCISVEALIEFILKIYFCILKKP